MESYLIREKRGHLNLHAKTFISQILRSVGKEQTAQSHFSQPQLRHKETETAIHLQYGPSDCITQDTQALLTTAPPVSQNRNVHTPFSWDSNNDQQQICSIMEKKNEMTTMLVQQQCLSSLSKKTWKYLTVTPSSTMHSCDLLSN